MKPKTFANMVRTEYLLFSLPLWLVGLELLSACRCQTCCTRGVLVLSLSSRLLLASILSPSSPTSATWSPIKMDLLSVTQQMRSDSCNWVQLELITFVQDLIGCITEPVDFVDGGTCKEQLMGGCARPCVWEPKMKPDQLFECISQVFILAIFNYLHFRPMRPNVILIVNLFEIDFPPLLCSFPS